MNARLLLLASVFAASVGTADSAVATPNYSANEAMRAVIERKLPPVTALFVNCPGGNTVPQPDEVPAIACEFRAEIRRKVVRGSVIAANVNGVWRGRYFFTDHPVPMRWRRCSLRGLGGRSTGQMPRILRVNGTDCGNARFLANDIGALAYRNSLRLPRRFTEAWYGTNTIGWVTNTFSCRGRVRVRRGSINPYGHETASCHTRFGDRFVYAFDQTS